MIVVAITCKTLCYMITMNIWGKYYCYHFIVEKLRYKKFKWMCKVKELVSERTGVLT